MDNKSEILEQKKQSETALASARANAEQRWKRGNQKRENIFARNFRPFYPRSAFFFTQESRAKSGMITPNFSFFVRRYVPLPFVCPSFRLQKIDEKSR